MTAWTAPFRSQKFNINYSCNADTLDNSGRIVNKAVWGVLFYLLKYWECSCAMVGENLFMWNYKVAVIFLYFANQIKTDKVDVLGHKIMATEVTISSDSHLAPCHLNGETIKRS